MTLTVAGGVLGWPVAAWVALVVDLTLKGLLVLALGFLGNALLRKAAAADRSRLWTAAFGLLLLLPLLHVSGIGSGGPSAEGAVGGDGPGGDAWGLTFVSPSPARPVAGSSGEAVRVRGGSALPEARADGTSSAAGEAVSDAAPGVVPSAASEAVPGGNPRVVPDAAAKRPGEGDPARCTYLPIGVGIVILWLFGVAVALAGLVLRLLAALRVRRRARPLPDPSLQHLAGEVAARAGLRGPVELRVLEDEGVPFLVGFRRPCLVLPAALLAQPRAHLRAVFTHELAHQRRQDLLRLIVIDCTCALVWYLPLAWIAARRARLDMERACDDAVLAAGVPATEYATQLLGLVRSLHAAPGVRGASLAMAQRSTIESRLLALLEPRVTRRPLTRGAGVAIVLGLLVAAWPAIRLPVTSAALPAAAAARSPRAPVGEEGPCTARLDAFLRAVRAGDLARVGEMLAEEPGLRASRDRFGLTALHWAAAEGHPRTAALLIEHGLGATTPSRRGTTPLLYALLGGHPRTARTLLEQGAGSGLGSGDEISGFMRALGARELLACREPGSAAKEPGAVSVSELTVGQRRLLDKQGRFAMRFARGEAERPGAGWRIVTAAAAGPRSLVPLSGENLDRWVEVIETGRASLWIGKGLALGL